jgi:hypothetical protein
MLTHRSGFYADVLQRLEQWIDGEHLRGWDPYDALSSPLLRRLSSGNRRLEILFTQLVKYSPWNLRPWLEIPKAINPKGLGLLLASNIRLYERHASETRLARIRFLAGWLDANSVSGFSGISWGYPFPWTNRNFHAPAGFPNAVVTCFIGFAFLDLYHLLHKHPELAPEFAGLTRTPLELAEAACGFILNDLHRLEPGPSELCFSYTPTDRRYLHNVNLLCARLLVETSAITGSSIAKEAALCAVHFTLRCQRQDGAWFYGEAQTEHWMDSFHTGFILVALKHIGNYVQDNMLEDKRKMGYSYWQGAFFDADDIPQYYAHRKYPLDVHTMAQAILTFLSYGLEDSRAVERARTIADRAVENMADPAGFFYFQKHRLYTSRIPYMRWAQAWMHTALSELLILEAD